MLSPSATTRVRIAGRLVTTVAVIKMLIASWLYRSQYKQDPSTSKSDAPRRHRHQHHHQHYLLPQQKKPPWQRQVAITAATVEGPVSATRPRPSLEDPNCPSCGSSESSAWLPSELACCKDAISAEGPKRGLSGFRDGGSVSRFGYRWMS